MENNHPSKIINNLYKRFNQLHIDSNGNANIYDYKKEDQIKKELREVFEIVGAVEVMSKSAIFKLVVLNGRLRAVPFHQFHYPFSKTLEHGQRF